ncbi:hypothetical protein BH10PLA1_BH10PLA1_01490 [soil metagenome]
MAKKLATSVPRKRAATNAKAAKIKEAGLSSRRVGKVSAAVKRSQARRDSKQ